MGWLTGWAYRKQIRLTGQVGAGTDYAVLLKVGESSGSSGAHFHVEGHCQRFPDDITVTDDDGTSELYHWLQETTGTPPNRVARFRVKVRDSLDSNVNIYVYYGKSTGVPTSARNARVTFLAFDDFNRANLQYKNPANPIFSPDGTGFDAFAVRHSHVYARDELGNPIFADGFKMWYEGVNNSVKDYVEIGYATSPDGLTWSRNPNPCLPRSATGWDSVWVGTPYVIKRGATYYMFYFGSDVKADSKGVGLATSPDGINWTRASNNPIIPLKCWGMSVLYENGIWKMWVTVAQATPPYERIVYAECRDENPDSPNWEVVQTVWTPTDEGLATPNEVGQPSVFKIGSTYYMFYHRQITGPHMNIGYAKSLNGINWTKYPLNPLLDSSPSGWDVGQQHNPKAFVKDGTLWLYYSSSTTDSDNDPFQIGLAQFPDFPCEHPDFPIYTKWTNERGNWALENNALRHLQGAVFQLDYFRSNYTGSDYAVGSRIQIGEDRNTWQFVEVMARRPTGIANGGYGAGIGWRDVKTYIFDLQRVNIADIGAVPWAWSVQTWYKVELRVYGSKISGTINGISSSGTDTNDTSGYMGLGAVTKPNGTIPDIFDYVYVRKYVDPEPDFSSAGSEESAPVGIPTVGIPILVLAVLLIILVISGIAIVVYRRTRGR